MKRFEDIWNEYEGPEINKWTNYFNLYDEILQRYQDTPINFLEIGINHGGSLEVWKKYFHSESLFYGIDINPDCKRFERDNVEIFIGSQNDISFLNSIKEKGLQFDVIIDDGGHKMNQQITSLKELFPILKEGGVYICEDTHTSYWREFGGGYKRKNTFIEYSKTLIDGLYYTHMPSKMKPKILDKMNVKSIHFYDGMIAFYKSKSLNSQPIRKGYNTVSDYSISLKSRVSLSLFLKKIFKL